MAARRRRESPSRVGVSAVSASDTPISVAGSHGETLVAKTLVTGRGGVQRRPEWGTCCRSSVRECRQAYATTLLSSVKRQASSASRIILSYRHRGHGRAQSVGRTPCTELRSRRRHDRRRDPPGLTLAAWRAGTASVVDCRRFFISASLGG